MSSSSLLGKLHIALSPMNGVCRLVVGFDTTYINPFQQLLQEHNHIGWRLLFNSPISNKWQGLQNKHLQQHGIKKIMLTGQSWSTAMIATIWKELLRSENSTTTLYMIQISPAKTWPSAAKQSCKSNTSTPNMTRSLQPTGHACPCAIQKPN
jgi:hypothetical protein